MDVKVKGDEQRDKGRVIVDRYLQSKGGSDFAWEQRFGNRENTVRFSVDSVRYKSSVGHNTLTDLENDPLQESKLGQIWDSRQETDDNG